MSTIPSVRRLTTMLACAALTTWPAAAAELGSNLDGLLAHARQHSAEFAAMRLEADAAAARVRPAGALPDPVFRVELENVNNYGNPGGFNLLPARVGETRYTLMQTIPLAGKRELRGDVAQADAAAASARAGAVWLELAARIKNAYAQYVLAAGNERLAREVLELLARLEQLAQARYAGGLVAQQDAIRAQLEQTAVRTELIALDAEKRQARARLNALLVREPGAALAEPQTLRPLPDVSVLDAGVLALRARSGNPSIAAEDARARSSERSRELAQRSGYPDVTLGITPTQMGSRITSWSLMVEVAIPLQRESLRAQRQEAEAMLGAQRARVQALASQLLGELGEHLAGLDAARRTDELLAAQLLPQSELSLRSALAAYENGRVDFATLLDAQRQIRKARADQLKARVEAQLRLAEIERIVGEDL